MLRVFPIVPTTLVLPLPENLHRRHRTRIFSLRHIQIVHEYDSPHSQLRPEVTPSSALLVQLLVHDVLGHVSLGLRGVSDLNVDEFPLLQLVKEHVGCIG